MRIEERWPNQTVRRGLGKSQHGGASWGWLRGTGWWRAGLWLCAARGVGPRDRSCTRRDRSGGGAIALTRFGGFVATIQCSFRPCPAAAPFFWGVGQRAFAERGMGWVCLGTGCWGLGIGVVCVFGGFAGQVLHSQGSLGRRGYRADALWGICCYDPVLVPALSRCCAILLGRWAKSFC